MNTDLVVWIGFRHWFSNPHEVEGESYAVSSLGPPSDFLHYFYSITAGY